MRILAGGLVLFLLLGAAAWGVPGDSHDDLVALKEKIQALLDEATLLEQNGQREEAARARTQAAELKQKLEMAAGKGGERRDDPLVQALHNLEKAIGALDKAGYERMSGELRESADKLRAEIKRRGGGDRDEAAVREKEAAFAEKSIEILRIALKGLAEAGKADAAEAMERAIHARVVMLKGRSDPEAKEIMRRGPEDGQLIEFLFLAERCWMDLKQPDNAAPCKELARYLQKRHDEQRRRDDEGKGERGRDRPQPGPEDRMARMEERLDRMERMLHDALERLQQREHGVR